MPNCFVKECGVALDDYVIVKDPNQNINVIEVDKKNGKVYFQQGWLRLEELYKIELGAWISLTYVYPNLLLMTIKNRKGVEISYPTNSIPATPKFIDSNGETSLVVFFRTTMKTLTRFDINSGFLVFIVFKFLNG